MKALVLPAAGHATNNFKIEDVEKPSPTNNQLLVKIKVSALNPVDYKMASYGFLIKQFPIILGCDMSGIVEAVGSEVKKYKVGDEVFGFTELGTPGCGTFAEYCLISEDLAFRKPENVDHHSASTIGVGSLTASIGVFNKLNVDFPSANQQSKYSQEFFLVWGGASSVGAFAVQLASLAGFKVIATASKRNFDLVKGYGAHEVFDYSESDVVSKIIEATKGSLSYAYDPICTEDTLKSTIGCISKERESNVAGTSPCSVPIPSNVKYHHVLLGTMPQNKDLRPFCSKFVDEFTSLLAQGKAKGLPYETLDGISSIVNGIELLMQNKVGGKKVVFTISQ